MLTPADHAAHVEACLDLARAAVDGGLLADAAGLDAGLTARGWTRGRRGGQWNPPEELAAGAITMLTPPSVDLIVTDPDDAELARTGDEISDRLVAVLGAPDSRDLVPGTDQQVSAVWERPDLSVVVTFLPSTSSQGESAPGVAPTGWLRFGLARPDVTDTEEDVDRARHLARHGSSAERWHLAGQAVLPDDVVEVLDGDDDPSVVRAVRVGAQRREWMGARAE